MAANMTTLEAVNELLESIGIKPVTALDTGGFSEAGDAERTLDRENRRVQMRGFYGNVIPCKAYTAASSRVDLAADVIAIKSTGLTHYRNFAMRETGGNMRVYDLDNDTFTITTGTVIHLRVTILLAFADAPPDIQDAVVAESKQIFQRRYKANPESDQVLGEERVRAEVTTGRVAGRSAADTVPPGPFALQNPGQPQG